MNLYHIPHHQLDKNRWDQAIKASANSRIYAQSCYLDAMSPGWAALVNDDYSYIMPLTFKKKYGIRYLYQPPFCQQLGIFATAPITTPMVEAFIAACKKQFSFAEIFIQANHSAEQTMVLHNNYILHLQPPYSQIRNHYTTDLLKKNLQRITKFNLTYNKTKDVSLAIATFKELYASRTPHVTHTDYAAFTQLAQQLHAVGQAFVRSVTMPNGEILACGLFLQDAHRIYNIASSTLPNGRTFEANHFLFDQLIQEFAGCNLMLDFEGSDIPGIERFYKKFGATNEPYSFLKWNNLPWPARLLKK